MSSEKRHSNENFGKSCRNGTFAPGETLPPVTQLAQQYRLSVAVVRQALQPLMAEGILYTIPRVGTFVGRPMNGMREFYLLVVPREPSPGEYLAQIQIGFEDRIAGLGGASLVMEQTKVQGFGHRDDLPTLAGLFNFAQDVEAEEMWTRQSGTALVQFAATHEQKTICDTVAFDDVEGGRQATRHLLSLGHRQIAFMGLHGKTESPLFFGWSFERARGWQQEMQQAGCSSDGMLFQPDSEPDPCEQRKATQNITGILLRRAEITAVVTANDATALGLFAALEAQSVPSARWPAIVSFDDALSRAGYIVTSMRLPWEEVGVTAADLLWERWHGRLNGPPIHRKVPMRLIPRLTSSAHWSLMAGPGVLSSIEG